MLIGSHAAARAAALENSSPTEEIICNQIVAICKSVTGLSGDSEQMFEGYRNGIANLIEYLGLTPHTYLSSEEIRLVGTKNWSGIPGLVRRWWKTLPFSFDTESGKRPHGRFVICLSLPEKKKTQVKISVTAEDGFFEAFFLALLVRVYNVTYLKRPEFHKLPPHTLLAVEVRGGLLECWLYVRVLVCWCS